MSPVNYNPNTVYVMQSPHMALFQQDTAMCVHANLAPSNSYCMKSLSFHTQTTHLLRTPTLASTTNPWNKLWNLPWKFDLQPTCWKLWSSSIFSCYTISSSWHSWRRWISRFPSEFRKWFYAWKFHDVHHRKRLIFYWKYAFGNLCIFLQQLAELGILASSGICAKEQTRIVRMFHSSLWKGLVNWY